ncbi:nitrate- and nitrite sensing domain-containing protein [Nocardia sp. NPDC058640]|uniref:sensor histidine kinase n=1 Tax=Nocardia sp. NPDC058640 TaxID=3346571 RepID=UPI00364F093C
MLSARLGVRTRILAIALIPSLTLLVLGMLTAGNLVRDSYRVQNWVDDLERIRPAATEALAATQSERLLSLRQLTGSEPISGLAAARIRVDRAFEQLVEADATRHQRSAELPAQRAKFGQALAALRVGVDTGKVSVADAYTFFNAPYAMFGDGFRRAQQAAPDSILATRVSEALRLLSATEAMSRSNAVALALVSSQGRAFPLEEFTTQVGFYHAEIKNLAAEVGSPHNRLLLDLVNSDSWRRLSAMETAVNHRFAARTTSVDAEMPMAILEWQQTADNVVGSLFDAYAGQHEYARVSAEQVAHRAERSGLVTGGIVLLGSVVALSIAVVLADRIIRRLRRLRAATLVIADEQLPSAIRLATQHSEIDDTAPTLDFGRDEIGEVAQAFEHAAAVALTAAVDEARLRDSVETVFVNIAHRSQVLAHRQLEILDEAERTQQDPALLEVFFRLDHLATRERRNAENLLILGGSRPGRQWRQPIPMVDVVRSAVGETTEYTRVRVARMPDIAVIGAVVADLIHLIAELVDNATAFSPPDAKVEISGAIVGKGTVVEVSDQGIGLTAAEFDSYNDMLATPTGSGLTALARDSRMGLFVVARLADAHGISVRLNESDFGGVRAIVLVPSALLAETAATGVTASDGKGSNHEASR